MASDETLRSETLDAIEARHESELAEVKKITSGMTSKKDQMRVLHIEGEVTDRHYLETQRWEEIHGGDEGEASTSDETPSMELEKKNRDLEFSVSSAAAVSVQSDARDARDARDAPRDDSSGFMTKSMKRRVKKERDERERDERVEREKKEAGPSAGDAEMSVLNAALRRAGLRVHEIKADGHCLYRAIGDQLERRAPAGRERDSSYERLRRLAAETMAGDAERYRPFLEDCDSDEKWATYVSDVRCTATWGGQLELQALATALEVPIEVYSANMPLVTMGEEYRKNAGDGLSLRVCHHRHAFGLGEHYNSAVDL